MSYNLVEEPFRYPHRADKQYPKWQPLPTASNSFHQAFTPLLLHSFTLTTKVLIPKFRTSVPCGALKQKLQSPSDIAPFHARTLNPDEKEIRMVPQVPCRAIKDHASTELLLQPRRVNCSRWMADAQKCSVSTAPQCLISICSIICWFWYSTTTTATRIVPSRNERPRHPRQVGGQLAITEHLLNTFRHRSPLAGTIHRPPLGPAVESMRYTHLNRLVHRHSSSNLTPLERLIPQEACHLLVP